MRNFYRAVFSVVLAAVVLCPLALAQHRDRDDFRGPYAGARRLVGRVLRDLERAQRMAPVAGRQRERYENAQRHLSQFDDRLSRDDFDKDKLDVAIDDVNNVVRNNVLSPRSRDMLRDDLEDLRRMREVRGRM